MRLAILGAGITGIAAAHRLMLQGHELFLINRGPVGGQLQAVEENGFRFDGAARVVQAATATELKKLAAAVQVPLRHIPSGERYLWMGDRLLSFGFFSLLKHPLTRRALASVLVHRWWESVPCEESVAQFARRKFGSEVADLFFDPLVRSIYGGEMEEISLQAGLSRPKQKGGQKGLLLPEGGFSHFVQRVASLFPGKTLIEDEAVSLAREGNQMVVHLKEREPLKVDRIISALPAHALAPIVCQGAPQLATDLKSILYRDLQVVHLGYHRAQKSVQGFGYLVPSRFQQQGVLGVVFDSDLDGTSDQQQRLTAMVRPEVADATAAALQAVQSHLGIAQPPDFLYAECKKRAIPQPRLGHLALVQRICTAAEDLGITVAGDYLPRPGIAACLASAAAATP